MEKYLNINISDTITISKAILNLDLELTKQGYNIDSKLYALNLSNSNTEIVNEILLSELIYSLSSSFKFNPSEYRLHKNAYTEMKLTKNMMDSLDIINNEINGKLNIPLHTLEEIYDKSISITKDESLTIYILRCCLNGSWVNIMNNPSKHLTLNEIIIELSVQFKLLNKEIWKGVN